jgi:hypothetical protein
MCGRILRRSGLATAIAAASSFVSSGDRSAAAAQRVYSPGPGGYDTAGSVRAIEGIGAAASAPAV